MLTAVRLGADWHNAKHLSVCLNNIPTKEQYHNYQLRVTFCKPSPYKLNDQIFKIYTYIIKPIFFYSFQLHCPPGYIQCAYLVWTQDIPLVLHLRMWWFPKFKFIERRDSMGWECFHISFSWCLVSQVLVISLLLLTSPVNPRTNDQSITWIWHDVMFLLYLCISLGGERLSNECSRVRKLGQKWVYES